MMNVIFFFISFFSLFTFKVVDLRHFVSKRRGSEKEDERGFDTRDGAWNMSRLVKAMERIKIIWNPKRCAAVILKVGIAAMSVGANFSVCDCMCFCAFFWLFLSVLMNVCTKRYTAPV